MAQILIHVQHLLGTGHTRRMAAIAKALAARGHDTVLASGGMPLRLDLGSARLVQLPACRAADARFKTLLDSNGREVDDAWRAARAAATRDLYDSFAPDLLLIELYPLGRAALRFELEPLVARAKAIPKLVSIRDVPQRPAEDKIARRIAALADFDAVLVHGDAAFLPATAALPELASLGERLIHTGYVAVDGAPPRDAESGRDEILVSVGGGAAGQKLLEAALALAASRAGPRERWRVLAGEAGPSPVSPSPYVAIEANRPDFPAILARARASISQAGYNTCVDLLRARVPAVLVPFAAGNEREQTIRAEAFAANGLARHVTEAALSSETLGTALDLARPPPDLGLSCEGAAQTAKIVERWL
jgi:predicted glycosyltransferase